MTGSPIVDVTPTSNVVQFFDEQRAKTPMAPAIQFHDKVLTYDELNEAANRLANFLIEKNIGKNNLVGLCLERSLALGIGVLGILKSGAAYIPFDSEYPADRISNMLQTAKCDIIITQQNFLGLFKDSNCRVFAWEDAAEKINQQSAMNPEVAITKDDLLYVLFTSGSTGVPKGVAMRHEPLVNLMRWQKKEGVLVEPARTLQYCSINFDVSFQEILTCWSTGGCLYIIDDILRYNPLMLLKFIEANKIERLFLVFSSLQQLCQVAVENKIFPSSLKDIITGGEQLEITPHIISFFENIEGCVLHNHYGPTETNVVTTYTFKGNPSQWNSLPPIGKPIANDLVYILDENLYPVKHGNEGELYVGGVCLARGYVNRDDLTRKHFIKDPFSDSRNARMYKTGDLVKVLTDGNIQYTGRKDEQVKIRGYRIELAEVELAISSSEDFKQVVVVMREDQPGLKRLVAYIDPGVNSKININNLRKKISGKLPDYMIPSAFVFLEKFPRMASGKIDRRNLPVPEIKRPEISTSYIAPVTATEKEIAKIWSELLLIDKTGVNDNFFDLGGNSLLAVQFITRYAKQAGIDIPIVKLYEHSSIKELCDHLQDKSTPLNVLEKAIERKVLAGAGRGHENKTIEDGIAIIGMSGRFPGARNVEELWNNLLNGVESTSFFKPGDIDPYVDDETKNDPNYIGARGIMDDADKFDAGFFGMNPRVAEITDPQQRIFLELAWEALEHAGYAADSHRGLVGTFAGAGYNSYYINNVLSRKDVMNRVGSFQAILSNEKDYLATLTSYLLDLKGPAMSIHTACSTSLVAVIEAVKSLRGFECDLAIAGGIAITSPVKSGHIYSEGSLYSKDGHTRSFSADATGTTFSDGGGIVVLKRYKDALKDGDQVYAVLRGVGINNDGHDKASFTAPSVQGQASVIATAQADAGIDAETISYIEAHGTATPIGDPIEVEALTNAFRSQTQEKQFCAIGSIKSNFGHLTAAAGVAGLIKTALALKHKIIPASINYSNPNPAIDFANSPFYVNTSSADWKARKFPRRAGVSAFGLGGTNAHVILEEAPEINQPAFDSKQPQLLILSAKTQEALTESASNLVKYLEKNQENGEMNLADVAYSLQTGRKSFNHKKIVVACDVDEAIELLQSPDQGKTFSKITDGNAAEVILIFPQQSDYYPNLCLELYENENVFRDAVNECCELLQPLIGEDLGNILFSPKDNDDTAKVSLKKTQYLQPASFIINYASAKLFMSAGLIPKALLGDGIGELVAACISEVMSLNDALKLVAAYSKINTSQTNNPMLSEIVKTVQLHKPQIPVLSSVDAEPLSISEATDPMYWTRQNVTNSFSDCIQTLWKENPNYVLLVCAPDVSTFSQSVINKKQLVISLFNNDPNENNDRTSLLMALGQLWMNSVSIDWKKIDSNQTRMKIPLPTYPFDRKRYWIDPPAVSEEVIVKGQEAIVKGQEATDEVIQPGQEIAVTENQPVNLTGENMMLALLMQQMQLQQQLITMMMLENKAVSPDAPDKLSALHVN
ncbi:MAG: amino acid adenylation domain-containing protein [Bacteroidia bacterium]